MKYEEKSIDDIIKTIETTPLAHIDGCWFTSRDTFWWSHEEIKSIEGNEKIFNGLIRRFRRESEYHNSPEVYPKGMEYKHERDYFDVGWDIVYIANCKLEDKILSLLICPTDVNMKHDTVQFYFIRALGKIKSKKAVKPLIDLTRVSYTTDSQLDPLQFRLDIAAAAVKSLADIGDTIAIPAVIEYIKNNRGAHAHNAPVDLAKFKDKSLFEVLVSFSNIRLYDKYRALLELDKDRALNILLRDIKRGYHEWPGDNEAIHFLAFYKEGRTTEKAGVYTLAPPFYKRRDGIEDALIKYIKNPKNNVKLVAVAKLGEVGRKKSLELLSQLDKIDELSFREEEWFYLNCGQEYDEAPSYVQFRGTVSSAIENIKRNIKTYKRS